ncbi:MAG: hypothetical protein OXC08_20795 [Thiotrichales bacterium]|nr:hypothetical protein [Thiotrichales bacterium]
MTARLIGRLLTTALVLASVAIPLLMGLAAYAGAVHPLVAAGTIGLAGFIVRDVRRTGRAGNG